ncbi:hypothetical protein PGB90_002030 [Kerria lacca]
MADIKWEEEAIGIINDIKPFVKEICVANKQENIEHMILLNLETYEHDKFCIKLCETGLAVVGRNYDTVDMVDIKIWYETPYALLTNLSKSYIERFKQSLFDKLQNLR